MAEIQLPLLEGHILLKQNALLLILQTSVLANKGDDAENPQKKVGTIIT